MKNWIKTRIKSRWLTFVLGWWSMIVTGQAQSFMTSGQVDFFMGVDFNYKDITHRRMYDFLINLTPGLKWNLGNDWQVAAQALVPIYNDYGGYYKRVRLNMAVLSKEIHWKQKAALKVSGGWFGAERYGLDLKGMYAANSWLALEAQVGWTGFCSMATGWQASTPERWTALGGVDIYLSSWNTEFRIRGGKFVYEDYGVVAESMRHFAHCTIGVYAQYSDEGGRNGGFKVVMMLPPYKRTRKKVNIRPASHFRLTYNIEANAYANRMYTTDPEENEREGWFDRDAFQWGSHTMKADFYYKEE